MADNGVITAKQNVINKGVAKENDISIAKGALSGAVLAPALTPIITSILPAAYAAQAVTNKAQMDALSKLQEAYYDSNGNMVDAVNSLDPITSNLISSLGYTDTQLEELCAASRANT
jgi:hypothetical protein